MLDIMLQAPAGPAADMNNLAQQGKHDYVSLLRDSFGFAMHQFVTLAKVLSPWLRHHWLIGMAGAVRWAGP